MSANMKNTVIGSKDLFNFCLKENTEWSRIEKLVFEHLPSSTNSFYLHTTISKYTYQVQVARHITNNIVITHYITKNNKAKMTAKEIEALKAFGFSCENTIDSWTKQFSTVLDL